MEAIKGVTDREQSTVKGLIENLAVKSASKKQSEPLLGILPYSKLKNILEVSPDAMRKVVG